MHFPLDMVGAIGVACCSVLPIRKARVAVDPLDARLNPPP